jgi:hypothetical protein
MIIVEVNGLPTSSELGDVTEVARAGLLAAQGRRAAQAVAITGGKLDR